MILDPINNDDHDELHARLLLMQKYQVQRIDQQGDSWTYSLEMFDEGLADSLWWLWLQLAELLLEEVLILEQLAD